MPVNRFDVSIAPRRVWGAMCKAASVCGLMVLMMTQGAHALTMPEALSISAGDSDERITALRALAPRNDPALPAFIEALLADQVKVAGETVLIYDGETARDAITGQVLPLPEGAEDVINNSRMSGELEAVLAIGKLGSSDDSERAAAIEALAEAPDESKLPAVEQALAKEAVPALKKQLETVQAKILLRATDPARRIEAAGLLAGKASPEVRALLMERMQPEEETDPAVLAALQAALDDVNQTLAWGERAGVVFTGISLGSILLLAALGLAITYGLMGVINMAHGELIMIGAYATFVVQNLFRQYLPGAFDYYIWLAVPMSFMAAAIVGAILERTVFRFLYGRPLETLLASWGISLILIQLVRTIFGAQNVQVENPSWLSGGVDVLSNLTLPYNRLAIIAFAALVLIGVSLLIARTRLGLFVRGVTQNRPMASCMGVNTARIDTLAFSLGAGIAGLAGCALSQVGNVGPDLGQAYIVDSFMVVVTGGVGQLAGTVYAALGLGMINKFLEGWSGAVLAKIAVLIMVVIFIQKRPQGLFAFKGREV
jgi:urea transport system permease protein